MYCYVGQLSHANLHIHRLLSQKKLTISQKKLYKLNVHLAKSKQLKKTLSALCNLNLF